MLKAIVYALLTIDIVLAILTLLTHPHDFVAPFIGLVAGLVIGYLGWAVTVQRAARKLC